MARSTERVEHGRNVYCPYCKQEFFTYSMVGPTECPSCHRRIRGAGGRHALRLALLLLAAGLVVAAAVGYLLRR